MLPVVLREGVDVVAEDSRVLLALVEVGEVALAVALRAAAAARPAGYAAFPCSTSPAFDFNW